MKTLNEVLTQIGHEWLLNSKEDQEGQIVHLVRTKNDGTVAMLGGDIVDCFAGRKTIREIIELDRGKRLDPPVNWRAKPRTKRSG